MLLWLGMLTLCDSCVLPDGLEVEQKTVEVNQPPRIVARMPEPLLFNPPTPLELALDSSSPGTNISIKLDDPNFKDKLYVRMFVDYDHGNFQVFRTGVSPPTTGPTISRPAVEFPNLHCSDLAIMEMPTGAGGMGAGGSGTTLPIQHLLELVVSDREFDDAGGAVPVNRHVSTDGFLVTAYWMFSCKESQ